MTAPKRATFFAVHREDFLPCTSWITWHARMKTLRVLLPWFWGATGLDFDFGKWRVFWVRSGWHDYNPTWPEMHVPASPPVKHVGPDHRVWYENPVVPTTKR